MTRNPDELSRFAVASNPAVIRGVLKNPRLTEDLVVRIAEQSVNTPAALLQQVEKAPVGQPLPLTVVRGQKELELSIRPAALPQAG